MVTAQADLVESVGAQWRQLVRPENGISEVRFYPLGDDMNRGRRITVRITKARASFELTEKVLGESPVYLANRHAGPKRAGAVLGELLEMMVTGPLGRTPAPVAGAESAWANCTAWMRRYSWLKAWQADLLASVDPERVKLTQVYDNSRDFGVLRKGDTAQNGQGVWVTVAADRVTLSLEERSTVTGSQVVRAETVAVDEASGVFGEMVGILGAGPPITELTAQEAFGQLLRDYVRPALRGDGYKPSGLAFSLHRPSFEITVRFRKSKFSTREAVEYSVDTEVVCPGTVATFEQANREAAAAGKSLERPPAGQWRSSLGRLAGHKAYTTRLRADADLEAHPRWLVQEIRDHLYPAIEAALDKSLVPPTPIVSREPALNRSELDEQYLGAVVQSAEEAGAQVSPSLRHWVDGGPLSPSRGS
jgi:hypothetical protein